ncbi:hypothetical protein Tco_0733838 [Tanacetum coccineum]
MLLAQAQEYGQVLDEEQLVFLADLRITDCHDVQPTIIHNAAFQTDDLDAYDTYCDDISSVKAILMAKLSSYGSDILSETHNTIVQDTHSSAQQDAMIMSVFQQMSEQMSNHVTNWDKANQETKFSREKLIDSQMDDMIQNRCALKQEINSLKQTLYNQVRKKESILQTLYVFKKESKEKENKYVDKEIELEKKIKELDNIVYKMGQSAQTVHMLMKPQVFYDDTHKQALGYQNPFYLKKAQRIKPTLYDGSIISRKHDVIYVVDEEETLILEEESRSKMLTKQNDPILIKQKNNISPINYNELNKLVKILENVLFLKKNCLQNKLSQLSNLISKQPVFQSTPVKTEAPSELPKVSMVKTSFQKLKIHLASFDKVVKVRTTPDIITEGSWGFEPTKAVFKQEVIPFIKTLRDLFKDFYNGLHNELNEVKTVFNQMEAAVEQCSVDKKYFDIQKKKIFLDNG